MDIGFTEEQGLLRETARKFLDAECDSRFVRARMVESGGGHRRILAEAREFRAGSASSTRKRTAEAGSAWSISSS